jgi:hypothetical protein
MSDRVLTPSRHSRERGDPVPFDATRVDVVWLLFETSRPLALSSAATKRLVEQSVGHLQAR